MLINLRTCLQCAEVVQAARLPAVYLIAGLGMTGKYFPNYVAGRMRKFLSASNSRGQVQNAADFEFLRHRCGCPAEQITMLPGAGVDLEVFLESPLPDGQPVVLFAGRLLNNKGLALLVEASSRISVDHRLIIAGEPDSFNPSSVSRRQLKSWEAQPKVEIVGFVEDMPALLGQSSLVCLPTWYPEGLPRILTEAAACGRAVIASNTPPCREAVIQGQTGLLVEPKNLQSLQGALESALSNRDHLAKMGRNARERAESKFEESIVNCAAIRDLDARL